MSDPTRLLHFSQGFGSDIKNHDYIHQNNLFKSANDQQRKSTSQLHPDKSRQEASGSAQQQKSLDIQRKSKSQLRLSQKPKPNWQALIPPIPTNDDLSSPSPPPVPRQLSESRRSKPPPSLQAFKSHGLELSDAYPLDNKFHSQYQQRNGLQQSGMFLPQEYQQQNQQLLPQQGLRSQQLLQVPLQLHPSHLLRQLIPTSTASSQVNGHVKKARKICTKCSNPIAGQFVRAMDNAFHIDCFRCIDCNKACLDKFFASKEMVDGKEVELPLCEYDNFRRLNLICYNCNQALRGSYIETAAHKYHLEHFCCVICNKVFDQDERFYEHDQAIYCQFHYSKLYATSCNGCGLPILQKFIKICRGGVDQQWHPECYMCFNLWSVTITVDNINPPQRQIDNYSIDLLLISKVWNVFYEFEVSTTTCISLMLRYASSGSQYEALKAVATLVLKLEYLFKGFDALYLLKVKEALLKNGDKFIENGSKKSHADSKDDEDDGNADDEFKKNTKYKPLGRLPRSLAENLVSYLNYLHERSNPNFKNSDNKLSLGTRIAQALKLMIKNGLHNALEYNKVKHSQVATDKFLREVNKHTQVSLENDPFDIISVNVPVETRGTCFQCRQPIEESCIKFNKIQFYRWHFLCLKCSSCGKLVDSTIVNDSTFSLNQGNIFCPDCTSFAHDSSCETGFEYVSKLMQMIFIDEIALMRTKYTLIDSPNRPKSVQSKSAAEKRKVEQSYTKAVDDVKRMKSTRQQQHQANKSEVRKSTIVVIPESGVAGMMNQDDDDNGIEPPKTPNNNLEIEQEPPSPDAFNNLTAKSKLVLDDIHRIVALEETKRLLPNAYKHSRQKTFGNTQDVLLSDKIIEMSGTDKKSAVTRTGADSNRKLYNKYYSELSNEEHFIIRHISVFALSKIVSKNYSVDKLLELIPTRKQQTFWSRIMGNGNKKKHSGPKVFGAPLEDLTEKYGIDSTQANGPRPLRIPAFIDDCLAALHQKDMSVEGIFRKNGNIKRLRELTEAINDNPEKLPDFSNENQIQLSALMKKFLREMPDPLFSFKLYELWIESQKYDDLLVRKRILKLVFAMLPKCNRDLLEILLFFFSWVASFSYIDENNGSKMNSHNLATVLAPNILYQKPDPNEASATNLPPPSGASVLKTNTEAGDGYFLSIEVVNSMIANQDEFSIIPEDIMEIYSRLLKENPSLSGTGNNKGSLTSKEIVDLISSLVAKDPDILNLADEDEGLIKEYSAEKTMTPSVVKQSNQQQANTKNAVIDA